MKRVKAEQWLLGNSDQNDSFGLFGNALSKSEIEAKERLFGGKQDSGLFELQTAFKGDSRFRLTERFTETKETDIDSEIRIEELRYRKIMDNVLADIEEEGQRRRAAKSKFEPIKRFDPSQLNKSGYKERFETKKKEDRTDKTNRTDRADKTDKTDRADKVGQPKQATKQTNNKLRIESVIRNSASKSVQIDADYFKKHLTASDDEGKNLIVAQMNQFRLFQ